MAGIRIDTRIRAISGGDSRLPGSPPPRNDAPDTMITASSKAVPMVAQR